MRLYIMESDEDGHSEYTMPEDEFLDMVEQVEADFPDYQVAHLKAFLRDAKPGDFRSYGDASMKGPDWTVISLSERGAERAMRRFGDG